MHRLLQILWMLVLFEMGVLLLFLPWVRFWDTNYFLSHYPVLRPYLMNSSLRGGISGLGGLDIFLAARMLKRRPQTPQTNGA